MTRLNRSGALAPAFGHNGEVPIPATPPFDDTDVYTLQVLPSAADPDGAVALFGISLSEYEWGASVFLRVAADGRSCLAHVPVTLPSSAALDVRPFTARVYAGCGYFTAGVTLWLFENGEAVQHVAVGRYGMDLETGQARALVRWFVGSHKHWRVRFTVRQGAVTSHSGATARGRNAGRQ
ncbi:hypothetical protein [Pseudomonas typographi]|uniref:Lipoprotein n=1 Tax=Pseudomonas typographi TaxID=2715964 RepID=A0ABR7Z0K1_9PSED|nr:hypothetical protein [Pseudomonas typographi]MBD1588821.1 hypothetical protein [Pseudomonas typographi]MBD1598937.1 hypothetical protein [Pseudomonas typographi]